MKNNYLFLGFFIIVFGIMLVLGKINFFFIFPIFLIFIGLSMISKKSLFSLLFTIFLMIACLSLVIIDSFKVEKKEIKFLPIEINNTIENVNLLIEAGNIEISSNDSNSFISGHITTNFSEYIKNEYDNSIYLSFTGLSFWNNDDNLVNKIDLYINDKTIINLDSFLSSVKINNIELDEIRINNTSFSNIDISVKNSSEIEIESFVSSIIVNIPEEIGLKIIDNTKQSSLDLDNLIKVADNEYQTLDYEEIEEKVIIKISGAFSSLNINNK